MAKKIEEELLEITEEQKELLQEDMDKENLKKIDKFIGRLEIEDDNGNIEVSFKGEDYLKLLEHFKMKGEELQEVIRTEVSTRSETKLEKSETDKAYEFSILLAEFIDKLGDSEGELVLKEKLTEQIGFCESNVFNRIEELYDAPVYSKLDMLKQKRIDYLLLNKRIEKIRDGLSNKKQKIENPNPYEEA